MPSLIANPRQDIPAAELAAGLSVLGRIASDGAGTGQAVLDSRAVSEYRIRLAQLDATITELESSGSPERAAPARGERDWITATASECRRTQRTLFACVP